jgi:chitobiase/beta-hexosaminidase-like protein
LSSLTSEARVARRRTRVIISTAAVLSAAAALAAPAGAAVNGTHVVAVIPESSALELSGYHPGDLLNVNVVRNSIVVGSASAEATPDPKDPANGILNVNGGAPPCWTGPTPQILPGDTVTVDDGGPQDSMVVTQVGATSLEQDPLTHDIVVHGFAIAPGNKQFDSASFTANVQARITISAGQLFANGKNNKRAGATKTDGTIAYDPATATDPAPTTWTADFPLSPSDAQLALANKNIEGVYSIGVSELTIGRTPVAAGGCPPAVSNSVTSFDRPAVNAGNVGTPLTVNGVAQADATNVSVAITDTAGHTVTAPGVAPSSGSFTTAGVDVSGLADGTLTATGTFTTPAQTFVGATMTIRKDVVVPRAPISNLAVGAHAGPQTVSLADDDASAKIHYTTLGTPPGAASPVFASPIAVDRTTTIRAVAIDAAGNVSPEASFAYTINAPAPAPGGGGTPGGGTTTIIQQVPLLLPFAPAPGRAVLGTKATAAVRPAVRGLSVSVLSGHALRVAMRLDRGAGVVRLRVFRARGGAPVGQALVTVVKLPIGSGRFAVTLRSHALRSLRAGSYVLEARAGATRGALGTAARRTFSVR